MRVFLLLVVLACVAGAQTPVADIHPSAPNTIPEMRLRLAQGRYELRNATMVDMIRTAWNVKTDNVVGGPEWLDLDRFDIIALAGGALSMDAMREALRALLKERFGLAIHNGERSEPAWEITAIRKPNLKPATGTEGAGCKPQPPITLLCQGVTMADLAKTLAAARDASGYLFNYPVIDRTGLPGKWDFSLRWQPRYWLMQAPVPPGAVSLFDALESTLGLKMALSKISNPMIVVDKVNRKPTPNAPGIVPSPQLRAEFEVTDIKPAEPNAPCGSIAIQPGGFVRAHMTVRQLILETQGETGSHRLEGVTKGIDTPCFSVVAKSAFDGEAPAGWNGPVWNGVDLDSMRAMMRSMLEDRFGLVAHTEDRQVAGYALVAAKPKLHRPDAASRPGCREGPGADGKDPRLSNPLASALFTCRNVTLAQFTAELNQLKWYGGAPVVDATGITGRYDMTINFSPPTAFTRAGGQNADGEAASEPTGAVSMQDALSKLGLKLQSRQVPTPVLVIDRVSQTPTAN